MAGGRPSKYKPEYCEKLVEHMSAGYAFESFSATIGVHRDTLYEWEKVHPEFSEAKKKGTEASFLWWEKLGMAGAVGKVKNFNAAVWIFSMKNKFGYRDKHEHTNPDQQPGKVIIYIPDNGRNEPDK